MKVEKKSAEGCTVKYAVAAEAAEIAAEYKKVESQYLRQAAVPGFRKGKVPLAVIHQKFADALKQDAQEASLNKLVPEALKEIATEVVSVAGIESPLYDVATGFSFTLVLEVPPKFDLPKYKKLAIKAGDTTVTDEAVDKQLADFRVAFAKYEDAAPEAVIGDGDFVNFDYTGTCDGQPLAELVPDQKIVTGEEGHWTQIEEGRFVPEILAALKGMKAGEKKTGIAVTFPKDNAPEPIKGKTCLYDVTVKSFRQRVLPDDATLLKHAQKDSIDAVRADIRTRLEARAVESERESRRNQAIDLLLKKADFAVPDSYVRRQTRNYLEDLAQRAKYMGLTGDYIEQNREEILAQAETNAVRQVRLSYILSGIAKEEALEVTEADVEAGLEKIAQAQRSSLTAADVRAQIEKNGNFDAFKEQLKAEKALERVVELAK